jgi:hypothetical protein
MSTSADPKSAGKTRAAKRLSPKRKKPISFF